MTYIYNFILYIIFRVLYILYVCEKQEKRYTAFREQRFHSPEMLSSFYRSDFVISIHTGKYLPSHPIDFDFVPGTPGNGQSIRIQTVWSLSVRIVGEGGGQCSSEDDPTRYLYTSLMCSVVCRKAAHSSSSSGAQGPRSRDLSLSLPRHAPIAPEVILKTHWNAFSSYPVAFEDPLLPGISHPRGSGFVTFR